MSTVKPVIYQNSIQLTLDLFKNGISIPEIASRRSLAISTIESHLRLLLEQEKVKINELISKDKFNMIKIASERKERLREIKDALPSDITYGEISYVLTALGNFKRKKNERKSAIQSAINTYLGNYCYRKCFNHCDIIRGCEQKFELLAKELKDVPMTFKEFNNLMKNGQIKVCKLLPDKRNMYVSWKRFEYYKWKGKDYWDIENENTSIKE